MSPSLHRLSIGAAVGLIVSASGCGGSEGPEDGQARIYAVPTTSEQCPEGGHVLRTGYDDDDDGELTGDEIASEAVTCNGEPGATTINRFDRFDEAEACPGGGVVVTSGPDTDRDGALSAEEVERETTICDSRVGPSPAFRVEDAPDDACPPGATGAVWSQGLDLDDDRTLDDDEVETTAVVCSAADGARALLAFVELPEGPDCPRGGVQVGMGRDHDFDGALGAAEVEQTTDICFEDTTRSRFVEVPAGGACPAGGWRIQLGEDDDGSGTLDDEEVEQSLTTCRGEDGKPFPFEVFEEPDGPGCEGGGARFEGYLDVDEDGMRDPEEPTQTSSLCGGVDALAGLITAPETLAPGAECPRGGVRLRVGRDDDDDAVLDEAEVEREEIVCAGVDRNALIAVDEVPFDEACRRGARRVRTGWDENDDGELSVDETRHRFVVCDALSKVPFALAQDALEDATYLQPYRFALDSRGGTGDPDAFRWTAPELPEGLELDGPSRELVGIPAVDGTHPITIEVQDEVGQVLTETFDLVIDVPLRFTRYDLPVAKAGVSYSESLTTLGGTAPLTFSILAGELPDGLSLSSAGTISGTSTHGGGATVLVQVEDDTGATAQTLIRIPQQTRWVWAIENTVGSSDAHLVEVETSTPGTAHKIAASSRRAQFSPDNRWVAIEKAVAGLMVVSLAGATPSAPTTLTTNPIESFGFSPDGDWLYYVEDGLFVDDELQLVDMTGSSAGTPVQLGLYDIGFFDEFRFSLADGLLFEADGDVFFVEASTSPGTPQSILAPSASSVDSLGFIEPDHAIYAARSGQTRTLYTVDVAGRNPGPATVLADELRSTGRTTWAVLRNQKTILFQGRDFLTATPFDPVAPGPAIDLTEWSGFLTDEVTAAPDGRLLLSLEDGGFYDAETGAFFAEPELLRVESIARAAWDPYGERFVLRLIFGERPLVQVGLTPPTYARTATGAERIAVHGQFDRMLVEDAAGDFEVWTDGPRGLAPSGIEPAIDATPHLSADGTRALWTFGGRIEMVDLTRAGATIQRVGPASAKIIAAVQGGQRAR